MLASNIRLVRLFRCFFASFPFRERNNLFDLDIALSIDDTFLTHKLHAFQKLSLVFIVKIFLKCLKFQPRYSFKCIHLKKKKCI